MENTMQRVLAYQSATAIPSTNLDNVSGGNNKYYHYTVLSSASPVSSAHNVGNFGEDVTVDFEP